MPSENKIYINPYKLCNCEKEPGANVGCFCSGGYHSYVPYYERLVRLVKPKKVLEWGPGRNSEIALQINAQVIAIEHVKKWIPDISDSRFTCIITHLESDQYISLWGHTDADIYFIDARRRAECADIIFRQATPESIVCMHDAQRQRYNESIRKFPYVYFLHRGFAIFSRNQRVIEIGQQLTYGNNTTQTLNQSTKDPLHFCSDFELYQGA